MPAKQLAYGTHYTATVESTGSNGKPATSKISFTTMAAPQNLVRVQSALGDGLVYGIGMPIVITLGHGVSKDDEAKVQKRLTVVSTPEQTGSWYWMSNKEIHYRPKTYWQPGTKLHIAVQTGGVPFGDGYYGRNDLTVDAEITTNPLQVTVDDKTHEVTVEQNGKVVGFDVSLIDLVAKDLGVEQKILDTPFENFKTGAFLNSGECDLAAAGMTITPERAKNVDFSVPYFNATQALLTTKKANVTSLDVIKAKKLKLGAQAETTGESYATGQGFDPVAFESSDAVLNGLRTNQVDAVIIDYPVAQGWLKDKANAAVFSLGQNIDTGEQYGISVKKGNTKLLAAIDKAIKDAKADGTYDKLYVQWIGPLPKGQS